MFLNQYHFQWLQDAQNHWLYFNFPQIMISLSLREGIGFASQLSEKSLPLIINLPDGAFLVDQQ